MNTLPNHSTSRRGIVTIFWLALLLCLPFSTLTFAEESQSPDSEETESVPPTGLNRPMDGTNTKTFEDSLAIVKEEISEVEYTTLMNAIGYLRVYDISARGDREKVYQNLDGKTPQQIMDMVQWRTK
jgi:hypothetical protein